MFCRYCGKEMDDEMQVCSECGQPVEVAIQQEAPVELVASAEKSEGKGKLIAAVCVAVAALVALAVVLLFAMGILKAPRANDVFKKDSYSVSNEDAVKKADVVVARLNDEELTNSELQIYYWLQVYDFADYYGSYLSYVGLDMTLPLDSQTCAYDESMTWQQYFLDVAVRTWQRYQLLCELADEADYELTDEEQASLDAVSESLVSMAQQYGYETVEQMLQDDLGPGCTQEAYMEYIETRTVAMAYYNSIYGDMTPTDEQVDAYFTAHEADFKESGITKESGLVSDVRHILVAIEGGTTDENGTTTYTDAEWAACYEKAEKILEEWKSGEATEESFAALVAEYTDDEGSASTGGLYEGITATSSYVEEFRAWAVDMSRQPGDTGIVKTQFGYHIMYFVDGEPEWKTTATSQYMAEELDNMIKAAEEKWPTKINYNKIVLGERATADVEDTNAATGDTTEHVHESTEDTTEETEETEEFVETDPAEETISDVELEDQTEMNE